MGRLFLLEMLPQPDDTTCGPTCLHALYRYYGDEVALEALVDQVKTLDTGGTLAVWLACDALRRGYRATIYTYNLQTFDPSWFQEGVDLVAKLQARHAIKTSQGVRTSCQAYLDYLKLGGEVRFEELTVDLIRRHLDQGHPILCGLSATYLYGCARESQDDYDDVGGDPTGHFVVVYGYDRNAQVVWVADPLQDNPGFGVHHYAVSFERLIGAILLGIVTYDANLLILEPNAPAPHAEPDRHR
jgi:hypothetical protein